MDPRRYGRTWQEAALDNEWRNASALCFVLSCCIERLVSSTEICQIGVGCVPLSDLNGLTECTMGLLICKVGLVVCHSCLVYQQRRISSDADQVIGRHGISRVAIAQQSVDKKNNKKVACLRTRCSSRHDVSAQHHNIWSDV